MYVAQTKPWKASHSFSIWELLAEDWSKAATSENASAGFKATGVYPFKRSAITDCTFAMTDLQDNKSREQLINKQPVPFDVVNQPGTSKTQAIIFEPTTHNSPKKEKSLEATGIQ